MKKTLTNGVIYRMAEILFDQNGFRSNKNIKTRMAVRQALKVNCAELEAKYKLVNEMVTEIMKETQEEYVEAGKATSGDMFDFTDKIYESEFNNDVNRKILELEQQTMDVEFKEIPQKEFDLYIEKNDGEFTDAELDVLEFFLEKKDDEINE